MQQLLYLLLLPTLLTAQPTESCITVLATAGGSTEVNGRTYAYTVGEVAIATLEGEPRTFTQGFHQPECGLLVSTVVPAEATAWGLTVFPNPTANLLHLSWDRPQSARLTVWTEDGRSILQRQLQTEQHQINCQTWPAGTYYLLLESPAHEQAIRIPFIKL